MLPIGYEQRGITLITFEVIEPAKVTAGAVHEKTEHRDKMVCDKDTFFIFPHRTKLTFEDRIQLNTFRYRAKKANPARLVILSSMDSIAPILCLFLHWNLVSSRIKLPTCWVSLYFRLIILLLTEIRHFIPLGGSFYCYESFNLGASYCNYFWKYDTIRFC